MARRRIARLVYLIAFIAVQQFTTVFADYPTLELIAILGVVVVFLDAVVCARRNWRSIDGSLLGEDASAGD